MRAIILQKLENELRLKPLCPDKSASDKQFIRCLLCDNIFEATPKSKIMNYKKNGSQGCPTCSLKRAHDNNKKIAIQKIESMGYSIISEYTKMKDNIQISFNECSLNHTWSDTASNLLYRKPHCKICAHLKSQHSDNSYDINYKKLEKNFIKHFSDFPNIELGFTIKNYKSTFKIGKVAVFLIPFESFTERKIINRRYFIEMKMAYFNEGIRLVLIYQNEYKEKPEIIISKIKNIANIEKLTSIMARKCIIKEISADIKGKFLEINHIQGNAPSNINLGAFHHDKLVAVMTFVKPRVLMGFKNRTHKNVYELARFAADISLRTPGISSKLLAFFKRNYEWNEIYSYADRRWSEGDLYYKLGFELDSISNIGYHYIIDGKLKHRWGYRKDKLKEIFKNQYDPSLTEYQNMLKMGYDRIWDCGNLKFKMF